MLESVVFVIDLLEEGGGLGQDGVAVDRLAELDQDRCGEPGDPVGGLLGEGLEFLLVGGCDRAGEVRVGSLVRNVSPAANERRYGADRMLQGTAFGMGALGGFRSAIGEREFDHCHRRAAASVPNE